MEQSSTYAGGDASRAIDGESNPHYSDGESCTHTTEETYAWWQVTLPQLYIITHIQITNRGDCCGNRLSGFSVLIDGVSCATDVFIRQGETKIVACVGIGITVKVMLPGAYRTLTICEFGICGVIAADAIGDEGAAALAEAWQVNTEALQANTTLHGADVARLAGQCHR